MTGPVKDYLIALVVILHSENSNGAMMDKMKAASPSKSRKTHELSPSLGRNTVNVRLRLRSMCETEDLTEFAISLLNPNLTWVCR